MRLDHHLAKLIDAEIAAGADPADVVSALLNAAGDAIRRAGHTDITNMAGELGAFIARRVQRGGE